MSEPLANPANIFTRIPGRAYLLLSVLIFAAANSVTRRLTEIGEQNPINGRNPISFCNVLFVGNLCALAALILVYGRQLNFQSLKQLSKKDWLGLIGVATLSGALAPALIFMALDLTAVNNVVLIGRIEPPLILALSILLLGERVNFWVIVGAIVAFVGVALTVLLQESGETMMPMMGFQVGLGELLAAGGAISSAIATLISKVTLRNIPLGIFSIIRTLIGTIIFFVVVLVLFKPSHFIDVFSPLLWQWMLIYGAVIVVGGQLCLFAGLKKSTASEVSLANSFSPIAGILAAYLILGEVPTAAQYMGGAAIVVGIILNQVGVVRQNAETRQVRQAQEQDVDMGFEGV
ncbi:MULTISPECIES: DMT family transporter [unclassified Coleofasciculus]|uniref:DMT family transporter n=1 Tax=unclassified Coleofasciculus TaxID=2692782 RepID=UPI00187EAF7C|nr:MULTISPECIES: DMT family transporter [unclassified Coleofasciculus]MBE9125491.1 DMT family transporter [Coleofasciculus sp. LEGE 07081]MBE9148645.1 DMT family transporter [Coleofasciculus sp. LEGE 07092]